MARAEWVQDLERQIRQNRRAIKLPKMQRRGERNGSAKLRIEEVRAIRAALAAGCSIRSIARVYRVSRTAIYHIRNGHNWKGTVC